MLTLWWVVPFCVWPGGGRPRQPWATLRLRTERSAACWLFQPQTAENTDLASLRGNPSADSLHPSYLCGLSGHTPLHNQVWASP